MTTDNGARRILIVDDDQELCGMLERYLTPQGFAVHAVHDGQSGLAAAAGEDWDIVVLDVMLPELDGFEVMRRLRADPRGATVPVLMLTAKGQRGDREVAMEVGANLFITKPFSNAEVVSAVERLASEAGQ